MRTVRITKIAIAFLLLSNLTIFAQKKIEGTAFSNGKFVSQFIGDKFTLLNNDTYNIYDLSGKPLVIGIKTPHSMLSSVSLDIKYNAYFEKANNGTILKGLDGKPLNPSAFSKTLPFITNNTVVLKNISPAVDKIVYIDTSGKEIISIDREIYFKALNIDKSDFSATDIFTVKKVLFSKKDFQPFSEGLTPIFNPVNKLYGYVDAKFNLVIKPAFLQVEPFFDGMAAVMDQSKNWGYVNRDGKILIPCTYSIKTGRFNSGLARVRTKLQKYGFINKTNEVVIKAEYSHATDFYKGFALVRKDYNSPVLLIDSKGAVINTFDSQYSYFDSSASLANYGTDSDPFFYPETLTQLVDFKKGVFVSARGLLGVLDHTGKVILPFDYKQLKDYHDGKMLAHLSVFIDGKTQNRYGIINEQGNFLIEFVDSEF